MINSLDFKVVFASTNKEIKGTHTFQKGMTSITGKNETGKSLRLEMIRYALFGSKALRAPSKTYKSIYSKLDFVLHGANFTINRAGNKVFLAKDTVEIATGTKPVNEAIIRLFGYDLEVFDMANACLQGDIEAMTDKDPSERKRMVDRTIGLDALDHVIDSVNEDYTSTKKALVLMTTKVVEKYEEPVFPEGITNETLPETEAFMEKLEKDLQRKNYIEGLIASRLVEKPKQVAYTVSIPETLDELYNQLEELNKTKAFADVRRAKLEDWQKVQQHLNGNDPDKVRDYLAVNYTQQWNEYEEYVKSEVAKPNFDKELLDFIKAGNELKFKKKNATTIDCPSCKTQITLDNRGVILEDSTFDWLRHDVEAKRLGFPEDRELWIFHRQIKEYEDWAARPPVAKPNVDRIANAFSMSSWIHMHDRLKAEGFDPATTEIELADFLIKWQKDYNDLKDKIEKKKFEVAEDERFKKETMAYIEYEKLIDHHRIDLAQLRFSQGFYDEAKIVVQKLRTYESEMMKYKIRQEAQASALETVKELETNMDSLLKVRKSLNDLKPKVKMYLLPSLNNVASGLISQMTGGERNVIKVDENFDIEVDGQPVATLSGSGKAVANLAVRIGLGTVLTNKVFSVFLADEIDATMDADRAEYTANCLKNLTKTISQIVLVSHKKPDADFYINT